MTSTVPATALSTPQSADTLRVQYTGSGGQLFALLIKNVLLTIVTVGIYAAWAKTERRKFIWQSVDIDGQRLVYTGNGLEIFKGYIRVAIAYGVFLGTPVLLRHFSSDLAVVAQIALAVVVVTIIPFAVYWSRAYLLSRTTWRGIRFGLEPGSKGFAGIFTGGYLLTILTLGFYAPVWLNKNYSYVLNRTRYGSARFEYTGRNGDVFKLFVGGMLLSFLTLGIYYPWYAAALIRYRAEHTRFAGAQLHSDVTGGMLLRVFLAHLFLTTITLGLAFPWVVTYGLRNVLGSFRLTGNIDFDAIRQRYDAASATGDGLADALDMDFGF